MRVKIAGPLKARCGQTANFIFKFPKNKENLQRVTCEIYSSVGPFEPSPHIPLAKMQTAGKPQMLTPTILKLKWSAEPQHCKIVAEENCKFYIMQDLDSADSPRITGKIKTDGWLKLFVASSFGWLRRNLRR